MAFSIFCFVAGTAFSLLVMLVIAAKNNERLLDDFSALEVEIEELIDLNDDLEDRIYNALQCLTPKSAYIGRKMAAILKGYI